MYDWGLGCEQDMEKAISWFVEAAYNQYAPAQTELGIMYQYGIMANVWEIEVTDIKKENKTCANPDVKRTGKIKRIIKRSPHGFGRIFNTAKATAEKNCSKT